MSDSTPRLPARPSLEQLRKQAKDRLHRLRERDSTATLSRAQYDLAREYGFESWPKLVHHVEGLEGAPRLALFNSLAEDLLAGYRGDVDALRRLGAHFGENYSPEQILIRLRDKLHAARHAPGEPTPADARFLVATLYDCTSWEELTRNPDATRYRIDPRGRTIELRPPLAARDWDTIMAVIEEQDITGIRSTTIDDAGLAYLARCGRVTRVELSGNQRITDDGLLRLRAMPQLEELDLSGWHSAITDRGLEVLRHLPRLKRFQASWPQRISDAGAANLAFCEQLVSVNLMGTPTGDGAINALRGRRHLTHFVSGKLVTDAGIPLLQDYPVFRAWHEGAPLGEDDSPNRLSLSGTFTNQGLLGLEGLEGLSGLSFFGDCPHVSGSGLRVLAALPRLEAIGCDGKVADDDAMRHFASMPSLRRLMIQGTIATDDGFAALSHSATVEDIWGRECPNLTGRGFAAMAAMPALGSLKVSCRFVDDAALATLPTFAALRSFMPMDVPDEGFRHVGRVELLEDLSCMYCRDTGDAATRHIGSLKNLKHYYAGKTRITDASLEVLGRMESLERLEFWECAGLTDAGMAALARLPNLKEIAVDGSPRVTRAGKALFRPGVQVT